MPHVSRNSLSKDTESKLISTLELVLTKLNKQEETNVFLLSILTPTERIMLAKRLAIIILLKEGFSDSEISTSLHVTRVTVSRLRYFLEARGTGYEIAIQVLEKEKALDDVKKLLIQLAAYAVRSAGGRIKV